MNEEIIQQTFPLSIQRAHVWKSSHVCDSSLCLLRRTTLEAIPKTLTPTRQIGGEEVFMSKQIEILPGVPVKEFRCLRGHKYESQGVCATCLQEDNRELEKLRHECTQLALAYQSEASFLREQLTKAQVYACDPDVHHKHCPALDSRWPVGTLPCNCKPVGFVPLDCHTKPAPKMILGGDTTDNLVPEETDGGGTRLVRPVDLPDYPKDGLSARNKDLK